MSGKASRYVTAHSSSKRENITRKKWGAQPPKSKRKLHVKTISQLQSEFCAAFKFNTPTAEQMKQTGEIDAHFIWVYKYHADKQWCFKSAVPLTADLAKAVADYLAGLDAIAPTYVNSPHRNANAEGASLGPRA